MIKNKLLLTSSGISNDLIKAALTDLLGKSISESSALFVPTAIYAYSQGISNTWQLIKGLGDLNWQSFGLLELTAIPSISNEILLDQLENTDVIIVGGGNKFYLSYWMEKSGLFKLLPEFLKQGMVYVGISAGSMMLTPFLNFSKNHLEKEHIYYDDEYNEKIESKYGDTKTMALVDFVIRPHFNATYFPDVNLENIEKWANKVDTPLYALDDQSALKVVNSKTTVISNGTWKLFNG